MKVDPLPETISTILAQAGGFGIHGAFAYIGAHRFRYKCPRLHGEFRSSKPSQQTDADNGPRVDYEVGIEARVNGRPSRAWTLIIAYEPNDTYTVWLVEGHARRKPDSFVLASVRDVYCDMLQSVIEQVYDRAIADHNKGFIPLS